MMSIIYSLMLLFTAVSYDEMAQFNKYALTLPVTRKDLVRSKYVLMLFLFLAGIVTGLVGKAVLGILIGDAGSVSLAEQGFSLLSVACIYLLAFDILLPVIFKKSPKSENGRLESRAGWKGLCRKGMTLLFVLIAVRLDLLMGTNYLRDAVCIAFIANEALSILENAGLMGMPIPEVLRQAIDILNGKAEKYTESRGER